METLTVDVVATLKGSELKEVCALLEIPSYGVKMVKANRIISRINQLREEEDEAANDLAHRAEVMLHELLEAEEEENGSSQAGSLTSSSATFENLARVFERMNQILEQPRQREESKFAPEVPTFSGAEDLRYTTKEWLEVVEQFATEFNWSGYQKLRYASSRLTGAARMWHQKAGEVFIDYNSWKSALLLAIPERRFTWDEKRRVLERSQNPDETIEEYVLEKWSNASRFGVTLDDTREFLLGGLSNNLIASTLAGRTFANIADFISAAHEVSRVLEKRKISHEYNRHKNNTKRSAENFKKPLEWKTSTITCLKCGKEGHVKKDCTNQLLCFNCKEEGHMSRDCPKRRETFKQINRGSSLLKTGTNAKINQLNKNENTASLYQIGKETDSRTSRLTKRVLVNGVNLDVAIDTQSDISLIREDLVEKVGPLSNPFAEITITGITQNQVKTKGYGYYCIEIDGVKFTDVKLYVIPPMYLSSELWLGKDLLEDKRVSVLIHEGKTSFIPSSSINDSYFETEPKKVTLRAQDSFIVEPKQTTVMKVFCEKTKGDYLIEHTPIGNYCFVPNCLINTDCNAINLPIINTGFEAININVNQVVGRAKEAKSVTTFQKRGPNTDDILLEELNIGDQTSDEEKKRLLKLCNKYRSCFAKNIKEIGCHPNAKLEIELTNNEIVNEKRSPHSYAEREQIENSVKELLDAGIVRRDKSSFNSPLVVIRKKDGSHRVCVDFRKLNSITKKETFPSPFIDELIESTSEWKIYSILDLASGYYQVMVDERSIDKTAFSTSSGQYVFTRMPFGLVNAPFVFNRVMEEVLREIPNNTLKRYMDDLIVGATSFEEMMNKLEITFDKLTSSNLTLKLQKCIFACKEVAFLGYRLSQDGLKPGIDKTEAIENFPRPRNVKEVRGFIGLCGYFRRFIKGFSVIAAPLTDLTKKDFTFEWKDSCEQAFLELKKRLISAPVLISFDQARDTEVHTDASKEGIGGTLMQKKRDGKWHPVIFVSRRTSPAESKYHATELELLGAVWVIKRLRMYLYGKEFTLITDCEAVRQGLKKRNLIPRIARWVLQLQEYIFNVKHRPGNLMPHVDGLSRAPTDSVESNILEEISNFEIWKIELDQDWIAAAQQCDDYCLKVLSNIKDFNGNNHKGAFEVINGRLYFKPKDKKVKLLVIPYKLRRELARDIHEKYAHPGLDSTVEAIRQRFYFPKMRRTVKSMIGACIDCLLHKEPGGKKQGFLSIIERKKQPFHTLHLDHIGPFPRSRSGKKFILVAVCNFTKMVFLRAVSSTSASHTIKALRSIIEIMWIPDRIVTDRGTGFKNKNFEQFCQLLGIKLIFTSTANPRANGQVERVNRTITPMLASKCVKEENRDWCEHVTTVGIALNCRVNRSTNMTPLEIMYGFRPRTVVDTALAEITEEDQCTDTEKEIDEEDYSKKQQNARSRAHKMITRSQAIYKKQFDRHRCAPNSLKEGDIVVVRRNPIGNDGNPRKLSSLYRGPYRVVKKLRDDLYEIGNLHNKRQYCTTAPVDQLKRWNFEDDSVIESDDESLHSGGPESVGWPNVVE